jgi:dipeptidyl aminopeptidase/acylaminoacyl peptidase
VVELHGGPEDQWLPRYQPFVQLLVARGYAVVQPNVRGSAGYGRKFQRLDDREHRADTLRDVGAVLDWIAKQPDLDPQRVVVMGTSYGGYLALASLLAYRDQLRGGITLGAITDLATFLEGTSAYRRDHRRAEYGDERDPETRVRLGKLSPLSRAGEIKRPLLVAHGARDPRVPQANAGALVTAVRAAGTPVWSLVAADEGHFFERPDNRDAFEALAVQFLDETTFPRTPSP